MAINESNATALVRFTGLGIVCFNKEKNQGEFALIRDDDHELSIKIQQPRFKDGAEKDLIVYEDIASFKDLQKKNVEIKISTNGNSAVKGYEIYQTEADFNRLESDDINDFRWVVDLNRLHNEELSVEKSENNYPVTKLSIQNGLFYVHKLDTELFFEKIEKNSNGDERKKEIFGNVAETIGIKLDTDEVAFTISVDGKEETTLLKRNSGLPYRIEIKNMNYDDDAEFSDMPDYYKYIKSANNTECELKVVDENSEFVQAGSVLGKMFCHPVYVDIASVDSLG